jgi:hypothetical protein
MEKITKAYIVIILAILCSCGTKKQKRHDNEIDVQMIDLFGLDTLKQDLLPIEECNYITLETNKECLIGKISQIYLNDDKIFVFDYKYSKSLFVFDMNGNFLYKVGREGKGPSEYLVVNNFDVDNLGNIYLHDQRGRKVLKFSKNGQYIEHYSYDFTASQIRYINN